MQSDVLAYARQRHLYRNIEQSADNIAAKLDDEEVHAPGAPTSRASEDLAGQPVNVDLAAAAAATTGVAGMFEQLGIRAHNVNLGIPTHRA